MSPPPRSGGFGPGWGGPRSTWIGARPTAGATALLIAEIATFLVYVFLNAPGWVRQHLALIPALALGREPWQLVTSGLVHLQLLSLLSSVIGIWFFGTAVEQQSSRTRMLVGFAAAQLAGALTIAAVGR